MANHEIVPTSAFTKGTAERKKIRDLLLLARLRLQRNVQCKFCHHSLLLGQGPPGTKACITHFVPPTLSTFTSLTVTDQLGEGVGPRRPQQPRQILSCGSMLRS